MHDTRCQAGQSAQAWTVIQIAQQRRQSMGAQKLLARRLGGQCQQTYFIPHLSCYAHPHIAAADNQHTFTAKSRGQRTKWSLV